MTLARTKRPLEEPLMEPVCVFSLLRYTYYIFPVLDCTWIEDVLYCPKLPVSWTYGPQILVELPPLTDLALDSLHGPPDP